MVDKVDLDKFDDLTESDVIKLVNKFGIESFAEVDRPKVLDMLLKHERQAKLKQMLLKLFLALMTLVPTVLLYLK